MCCPLVTPQLNLKPRVRVGFTSSEPHSNIQHPPLLVLQFNHECWFNMKHWSWSYTYHQEYYPYPYAECFDCAHTPGSLSRESLGTISPELWLHGHLWDWTVGSSIFIADTQSLPSSFNRTQPPFTRDPRPPRASNRKKIAITNSSIKQTPYPPDTHQRAHPRRAERLHPCTPDFHDPLRPRRVCLELPVRCPLCDARPRNTPPPIERSIDSRRCGWSRSC